MTRGDLTDLNGLNTDRSDNFSEIRVRYRPFLSVIVRFVKSIAASVLQMSPVKIDIVAGNFKNKKDMSFCHKPSKRQK